LSEEILNSELNYPPNLDTDTKDLIQKLLKPKINERLGSNGDQNENSKFELLNHPFFDEINLDKIFSEKSPINASEINNNSSIDRGHLKTNILISGLVSKKKPNFGIVKDKRQ